METAKQVLKNKVGTCWDQVEFEREWLSQKGYEVKTFFEMIYLDYESDYPTHTFLAFKSPKENGWNLFENADYKNRGIYHFDSLQELLHYQLANYLELLKEFNIKKHEIEKLVLREYSKPKENASAEQFLEHVLSFEEYDFTQIHKKN